MTELVLAVDGASSEGFCGAGVVLYNKDQGIRLGHESVLGGESIEGDNFYAETHAIVEGCKWLDRRLDYMVGETRVTIVTDSATVVKLINGKAKSKNSWVNAYIQEIKDEMAEIKARKVDLHVKYIPRKYLYEANYLAQSAAKDQLRRNTEAEYPFLKKGGV